MNYSQKIDTKIPIVVNGWYKGNEETKTWEAKTEGVGTDGD